MALLWQLRLLPTDGIRPDRPDNTVIQRSPAWPAVRLLSESQLCLVTNNVDPGGFPTSANSYRRLRVPSGQRKLLLQHYELRMYWVITEYVGARCGAAYHLLYRLNRFVSWQPLPFRYRKPRLLFPSNRWIWICLYLRTSGNWILFPQWPTSPLSYIN